MTEKELDEFMSTATPSNLKEATKLDPFMKTLLEKKGLNKTASMDDEQQKIHEKLFKVMGPLSAAWWAVQEVVNGEKDPDPAEVLKHLNDSIILLGQAINKVGYERRLSVLSSLNDNKQAKKQLKDNQDEIKKESKFLFGEEFQKQLKTCAKAQESADKLLSRPGKRKWMRPTRPTGGVQSSWSTSTKGRGGWKRGKGNYSSFTLKQGVSLCTTESKVGSLKPKKSFLKKFGDRNNPVSRVVKIFSKKLGKDKCISDHPRDGERLETSPGRRTSSVEGTKSDPHEGAREESSDRGDSYNDSERCPEGGTICKGPIYFNNICQTKKGDKQIQANNKSKETECSHTLHSLQNGRDEECVRPVESGRLHGKNRPEGCLLACRDSPGVQEISAVSMGPKILRNWGASLWGRSRSKNLHKVKSTPDCSKKANDQASGLFERFFNHGQNKGGSHTGKRLSTCKC